MCSPICGGKLLQLLIDCNVSLDIIFDGMDGLLDGRATVLSDLRTKCLDVSPVEVIQSAPIIFAPWSQPRRS